VARGAFDVVSARGDRGEPGAQRLRRAQVVTEPNRAGVVADRNVVVGQQGEGVEVHRVCGGSAPGPLADTSSNQRRKTARRRSAADG
jgi:hypothetical protein